MKKSLTFILLLLAVISCTEPDRQCSIDNIYNALAEQKKFYYKVNYSISKPSEKSNSNLTGLVSLNRNLDSGISAAYFGLNHNKPNHYLHSLYLNANWIHEISSNIFDIGSADILFDSLHSPILLNPQILYDLNRENSNITKEKRKDGSTKWVFELEKKADRLIVVWDSEIEKLMELEYLYNVDTNDFYSRRWQFSYLTQSDYTTLSEEYRIQNEIANQPFL